MHYQPSVMYTSNAPMQNLNILRPRQNGHQFAEDIYTLIPFHQNYLYFNFTEKCSKSLVVNKPGLVQIMAWRWTGTSHYLDKWWPSLLTRICVTRLRWVNLLAWLQPSNDIIICLLTYQHHEHEMIFSKIIEHYVVITHSSVYIYVGVFVYIIPNHY